MFEARNYNREKSYRDRRCVDRFFIQLADDDSDESKVSLEFKI